MLLRWQEGAQDIVGIGDGFIKQAGRRDVIQSAVALAGESVST